MSTTIRVPDLASFSAAFGTLGMKVGSRTGAGKRSQADKEWFVVRRFLETALRSRIFVAPFSVQRVTPPAPDFALRFGNEDKATIIEVTESTHPDDQREMTEFERSDKPAMLLGDFGGRFADGASQPGLVWVADIFDAVKRKKGKTIYSHSGVDRHLVIYPNSNASALLFDSKDERAAFQFLLQTIPAQRDHYVKLVNGCAVHVLGKDYVCFDVFGKAKLARRRDRDVVDD